MEGILKMKFIKFLVIIFVGLFIAGCSAEGGSSGVSSGSNTDQFRGGTNSVSFELEPDSPPEIVYDSGLSPFDVIVKVENEGEWDVPENSLRVLLEGFTSANWGGVETNLVLAEPLEGYDVAFDIQSIPQYASFENIEYQETLVQNTYTHNYIVKGCFPYGTKVTFTACVDRDARRSSQNDDLTLCEGFSSREYSVSSGLIGVRALDQQVVNGKLRLIFTLVNEEQNNPEVSIFLPNTLNNVCEKFENRSIQSDNSVMISLSDPNIGEFECNGGNRVVFSSSEGTRVTCEADISALPIQELPLVLTVEYETLKAFRESLLVERSQ